MFEIFGNPFVTSESDEQCSSLPCMVKGSPFLQVRYAQRAGGRDCRKKEISSPVIGSTAPQQVKAIQQCKIKGNIRGPVFDYATGTGALLNFLPFPARLPKNKTIGKMTFCIKAGISSIVNSVL